ncbi:transcription antitermination factor NusB [Flexivirga caeni]|uniref:Transcription antitermination protein NusB n=1 Tax=Flexivirga caeni TaxID=2294115 RepID=A0A3M9LXZ9_9MICO|nr:transcription antitermination factor NusB [Flexivirga caeni]RNI18180.1 transcription antitermination factor NusB [Flexivirga caeni]
MPDTPARHGSRTKARKKALDLLFEAEQRGVNARELVDQRVAAPTTQTPLPDYTVQIVRGVVEHWAAINDALQIYGSSDWPPERMPAVDRALLRAATWELVWGDVDSPVVITEAVRLAQELSTDSSPKFVNGLLDKIAGVKQSLV